MKSFPFFRVQGESKVEQMIIIKQLEILQDQGFTHIILFARGKPNPKLIGPALVYAKEQLELKPAV